MSTFTGIVASVVVHSSAAALSHFGLVLEPTIVEPPPSPERVVVRSKPAQQKIADGPEARAHPHVEKT